jgi:hypothetical protein
MEKKQLKKIVDPFEPTTQESKKFVNDMLAARMPITLAIAEAKKQCSSKIKSGLCPLQSPLECLSVDNLHTCNRLPQCEELVLTICASSVQTQGLFADAIVEVLHLK